MSAAKRISFGGSAAATAASVGAAATLESRLAPLAPTTLEIRDDGALHVDRTAGGIAGTEDFVVSAREIRAGCLRQAVFMPHEARPQFETGACLPAG